MGLIKSRMTLPGASSSSALTHLGSCPAPCAGAVPQGCQHRASCPRSSGTELTPEAGLGLRGHHGMGVTRQSLWICPCVSIPPNTNSRWTGLSSALPSPGPCCRGSALSPAASGASVPAGLSPVSPSAPACQGMTHMAWSSLPLGRGDSNCRRVHCCLPAVHRHSLKHHTPSIKTAPSTQSCRGELQGEGQDWHLPWHPRGQPPYLCHTCRWCPVSPLALFHQKCTGGPGTLLRSGMPFPQGCPQWPGPSPTSCHLQQEKNTSTVRHYSNPTHFVDLNKEGNIFTTEELVFHKKRPLKSKHVAHRACPAAPPSTPTCMEAEQVTVENISSQTPVDEESGPNCSHGVPVPRGRGVTTSLWLGPAQGG